jgi:hypothetical protein
MKLLRRVSEKYDPEGVFWKLCPGGFKIPKWSASCAVNGISQRLHLLLVCPTPGAFRRWCIISELWSEWTMGYQVFEKVTSKSRPE